MRKKKPEKLEGVLIDKNYRKIAFCSWVPEKPTHQLVLLHGFSEHLRRYDLVSEELSQKQIAVHLMDFPGHGLSEGLRGHIDQFQEYVNNIDWFIQNNPNFQKDLPSFLFGHSMGGLIATHYCLEKENQNIFKGLILSAPLFGFNPLRIMPIRFLSKVLGFYDKNKTYPKTLNPSFLTRDQSKWQTYHNDPFRLHRVSPNLFQNLFINAELALEMAQGLQIPLLVFKAREDKVVSSRAIQKFYQKAGSQDKKLVIYTKAMHEILHEKEKERMLLEMTGWMEKRK